MTHCRYFICHLFGTLKYIWLGRSIECTLFQSTKTSPAGMGLFLLLCFAPALSSILTLIDNPIITGVGSKTPIDCHKTLQAIIIRSTRFEGGRDEATSVLSSSVSLLALTHSMTCSFSLKSQVLLGVRDDTQTAPSQSRVGLCSGRHGEQWMETLPSNRACSPTLLKTCCCEQIGICHTNPMGTGGAFPDAEQTNLARLGLALCTS